MTKLPLKDQMINYYEMTSVLTMYKIYKQINIFIFKKKYRIYLHIASQST